MLSEIRLENFKCFNEEVVLPCAQLNLLTGINSKGKSTALQALLMLHQSISGQSLVDRIQLNGSYVRLGSFREVQNRDRSVGDPIFIGLDFTVGDEVAAARLELQQKDSEERWASIMRVTVERFRGGQWESPVTSTPGKEENGLTLDFRSGSGMDVLEDRAQARLSGPEQLGRIHYVSADRLGPQDFFPRVSTRGFLSVGVRGEHCAELLYRRSVEKTAVAKGLLREEAPTVTVVDQTSAWLAHVFGGGAVRVQAPHSTILTLEMNSDGLAQYVRPVNLGFGYSYVLPILVAGLIAREGEFLIVENPEAHLHPLAQSRVGEFLAQVSAAGVQVFVESHSEHILNAFRLAVRDTRLRTEDLTVLYFRRDTQDPVLRVSVEADGRIPHWPEGFFDQRMHDFQRLFGE